jgi:hypothetical protein
MAFPKFDTPLGTPTGFQIFSHIEAYAGDIIQRANSIMDYDIREEVGKPCLYSRVCPVLRALYKGCEKKSVAWFFHVRKLFC